MLHDKTIGFIGTGNMGEALISGVLGSGSSEPERIVCSDVRNERLDELKARHGIRISADNSVVAGQADIIVYAVKPQILHRVFQETLPALNGTKLIISIAAGVPLASLAALSPEPLRLVRAMPNICVAVKAGATAIASDGGATIDDLNTAAAIFNAVGRCVILQGEHLLDAVTGLSGSGPAYVFMVMDALADAGVKVGLTRHDALLLAAQTLLGAAQMHLLTQTHPGQLKDQVTSPGGTTIAGLHALEKGGLRGILINAVEAAAARSKELGVTAPQSAG